MMVGLRAFLVVLATTTTSSKTIFGVKAFSAKIHHCRAPRTKGLKDASLSFQPTVGDHGNFRKDSCLPALIYGADGTVLKDDEFNNSDDDEKERTRMEEWRESLDAAIDDSTIWKRIGCAFAPPPHDQLIPSLVENAELVKVGNESMDIALAVPAREGGTGDKQLAQVLVSVGYPQPWPFEDDCDDKLQVLLEQVRILEGHSTDRLTQRRNKEASIEEDPKYYENLVVEKRWMERLQTDETQNDHPSWWKPIRAQTFSEDILDECKLLKKLLNEDEFEDELRALFVEHYHPSKLEGASVLRASVASIGSSGLYLRARVLSDTEQLLAVAIPYRENTEFNIESVDELREAVLVLVESVDPMPMPVVETEEKAFTPFNEQVVAAFEATEDLDEPTDEEASEGTRRVMIPQPLPPEEEAKLQAKYAAIESLEERAFTILCDLKMIQC